MWIKGKMQTIHFLTNGNTVNFSLQSPFTPVCSLHFSLTLPSPAVNSVHTFTQTGNELRPQRLTFSYIYNTWTGINYSK